MAATTPPSPNRLLGLPSLRRTAAPDPDAAEPAEPEATEPAEEVSTTLRLAFPTDMDPPDPDTNYQLHGNQVTEALYEGLLRYSSDNTNKIVGLLAETWDVADDGMTYTFTLREGLTFADGSPLDSETLKFGFERRFAEAVFAPSGYMLLPVDRYETPDPPHVHHPHGLPGVGLPDLSGQPGQPQGVTPSIRRWWPPTRSTGTGPSNG